MNHQTSRPLALMALASLLAGPLLGAGPRPPEAKIFAVDAVHSSLVFRVKYAGVSSFWGRFNEFSGTVTIDEKSLEKASFDLEVKAASVDSANTKRDSHLKSPDFFSAKQFPKITFKSSSVKSSGDGKLEVTGELTLRGVTKTVRADVTYGGTTSSRRGGTRVGLDGVLKIKRSEFGMTFGEAMLGDEVEIHMGLTAVAK